MVTTVPVSSLATGWNGFTASAPFDYSRWGNPGNVQVNVGGSWRGLNPGETIPAGAQFRVYTSQAGAVAGSPTGGGYGGQETVTGQDLTWQNHQIAMDLLNAQNQMASLDLQAQQLSQNAEIANAQLQAAREQAQLQFQTDSAQIGVQAAQVQLNARIAEINAQQQAADLNFRQRLSEVEQARADAQLNLQAAQTRVAESRLAAQLNFDQRQSKAQLEQNIMGMLADRSGPQDWIKYSYLLDNANAANPQASTTIDPFSLLSGLVQEYTPDLTGLEGDYESDLSGLNQPHNAPNAGGNWEAGLNSALSSLSSGASGGSLLPPAPQVSTPGATQATGSGGGITTGPSSSPSPAAAPVDPAGPGTHQNMGGPPGGGFAQRSYSLTPPPAFTPGTAFPGDPGFSRPANLGITDLSQATMHGNASTGNATPEQIRRLLGRNRGGSLVNGMAIVGDKPSGEATGYEEAIIGDAVVLDRHKTKRLIDAMGGRMNRLAGGGIVSSAGGDYDPGTITYNTYSDEDLYNQPFLRRIRGEMPGRGFGAIGGGNITGRFDLPTNLSIQRFNALLPSQRAMTEGAYNDPDAGVYFDDIVEMAKRASVGTRGFGGGSMYGG